MEWVETTGKSLEEAKGIALDQLGVAEEEAEFEIIEEPRPGLFGLTRGEARVRARVRPRSPRAKTDRRERRGRSGSDASDTKEKPQRSSEPADRPRERSEQRPDRPRRERPEGPPPDPAQVAASAEAFLQGLARALGAEASTDVTIEDENIEVRLNGSDLGLLVGPRGSTLQAVQDITRVVSQRRTGDQQTRLRIDIGGYRAKRREALSRFVTQVADEVVASGTPRILEAMASADRKIVHDALNGRTDISTHSEGDEPNRRVVISPASAESA
jgi:spoIIIJ-associated protein